MDALILTAAQAEAVDGEVSPGWALAPRQMLDGTFMLPATILANDRYAAAWPALSILPRRDVTAADFTPAGN